MFRDAKTLDQQRTAQTFDQAYSRYAKTAETWFDGSVGSIDQRITACQRLQHAIRFHSARLSVSESHDYWKTGQALEQDYRALQALREDLLTGAAGYADLPPAGYHTAGEHHHHNWYQGDGGHDDGVISPNDYPDRKAWMDAKNMAGFLGDALAKHKAALDPADRRWVTLEGAKFVAANTEVLGDAQELAVRAQHHAAVQTSTYSQQRSASVCRAFVAEVVELGRKTYRPPVPRTAAYQDFDAAAMYLC